ENPEIINCGHLVNRKLTINRRIRFRPFNQTVIVNYSFAEDFAIFELKRWFISRFLGKRQYVQTPPHYSSYTFGGDDMNAIQRPIIPVQIAHNEQCPTASEPRV